MCKKRDRVLIILCLALLICIAGLIFSGKTAYAETIDGLNVTLTLDGVTYRYTYPEITYKSGFEEILIKHGIYDSKGRLKNISGQFSAQYEFKNLKNYLEKIALITDKAPVPAEVGFDPKNVKFKITPDIKGRKLNIEKIVKDVEKSLSKGKSYKAVIESEIIEADVTENSLKRSFNLRSSFSTNMSESTLERKNNIRLSLAQFNGLIIKPGEIISFNETVGPRTAGRGYKTAKIILDGEFVDGVGGGVCQTSTTLYNALLLSDLEITAYKNHSLKVSYVPPSFDAMVSSVSDLKFKNNSNNYIYIRTICTDKMAKVEIYGEKLNYKIVRRSEVVFTGKAAPEKKIIDIKGEYLDKVKYKDEMFFLQYSKPEIKSIGYLDYIKNGKVIKSKKIRKDTYKAQTGTVVYGNLERPKPPPPIELPELNEPLEPKRNDYLA